MFDFFRKKKRRAETKIQRLEAKINRQYETLQEWELYHQQVHGEMRQVALEMESKRNRGKEYII